VIVLDTNVIAELTRAAPSPVVLAWARKQPPELVFTTAVCEAELLFGLAAMRDGPRRAALARAVDAMLGTVLGGRVLPFDRAAARIYGELAALYRRVGRPVGIADLQIAAIARARRADAIATRNAQHFADCGVPVIGPWSVEAGPT
jgi:predicted nucleic acid-binding protein